MTIEAMLAELIRETVRSAVAEALTDVRAELEGVTEKLDTLTRKFEGLDALATERDVQVVVETIAGGIEEITRIAQEQVLETGRAELRLARAAGRAS